MFVPSRNRRKYVPQTPPFIRHFRFDAIDRSHPRATRARSGPDSSTNGSRIETLVRRPGLCRAARRPRNSYGRRSCGVLPEAPLHEVLEWVLEQLHYGHFELSIDGRGDGVSLRASNKTPTGALQGKPCYFGTRAFSSSSQFCTRIICEAEIGARSFCLTIRKR